MSHSDWDMFSDITAINAWLDGNPRTPHEDSMRVMKIGEEIGEATEVIASLPAAYGRAVAAYIGMTGQNPRKGVTHSETDLLLELADVAITALAAIQHFTGNEAVTKGIMASKIQRIITRSNIPSAREANAS